MNSNHVNKHHIYQGDMILNKKRNIIAATQNGPDEKPQVKIKKNILKKQIIAKKKSPGP